MRKMKTKETPPIYIHPKFSKSQPATAEKVVRAFSPSAIVAMTNTTIKPTEMEKMNGSDLRPFLFFPSGSVVIAIFELISFFQSVDNYESERVPRNSQILTFMKNFNQNLSKPGFTDGPEVLSGFSM
ncbi:hypothetical protein [Corynebacterium glutamicum]|uniref:hypothetical protein n=2 Tax=Corynebacterium glutamicum TaxID=1718 RepID=UPI0021B0E2AF|nr:hypothetical protein [Corynebacterium glutamicum]